MPPWKKWKLEREEKKRREEEERKRQEEKEREWRRQVLKKYGPAMAGILAVFCLSAVPLSMWVAKQENENAAANDLSHAVVVFSEPDRGPADGPDTGTPPEDAPASEDGTPPEQEAQPEVGTPSEQSGETEPPPNTVPSQDPGTQAAPESGESDKAETPPTTEPSAQPPAASAPPKKNTSGAGTTYVLNTNSMKFHKPYCSSAKKISAANRWEYTGSRSEVIAMGYDPCKNCNP